MTNSPLSASEYTESQPNINESRRINKEEYTALVLSSCRLNRTKIGGLIKLENRDTSESYVIEELELERELGRMIRINR